MNRFPAVPNSEQTIKGCQIFHLDGNSETIQIFLFTESGAVLFFRGTSDGKVRMEHLTNSSYRFIILHRAPAPEFGFPPFGGRHPVRGDLPI